MSWGKALLFYAWVLGLVLLSGLIFGGYVVCRFPYRETTDVPKPLKKVEENSPEQP